MMGSGQGTVDIKSAFIAAGCNRVVGAVAWGPCDLVAFAAHHTVGIFSPADAKILITLPGHKDYVNYVLWLPASFLTNADGNQPEEHFLLSGSADGAIILWAYLWTEDKWRVAARLPKAHEKAVTSIAAVMVSPSVALLSSTSSDLFVRIWNVSLPLKSDGECNISNLQALEVGSRAMVATSLTILRGSQPIVLLAVGGLDNHIHFYAGLPTGQFNIVCQVKGHQDWIRDLDFSFPVLDCPHATVFLASCSQDKTIGLWRISRRVFQRQSEEGSLQSSLRTFIDGPAFRVGLDTWQVSLESLLLGHEDWVYSVRWKPLGSNSSLEEEATDGIFVDQKPMSLLSASMDRMMMIWRPDSTSGIWVNEITVGELAQSALGFYGGVWSPRGDAILAHGYNGSFHLWQNVDLHTGRWQPHLAPSGHSAPVVDLAWAKSGQFLLSVSHDQTARLFACWNWNKVGGNPSNKSWHEIGRPQVHGHDLSCLAVVRGSGNHCYVSGADEKVARVFEAPVALLETLAFTCGGKEDGLNRADVQILGANMSALGLSQKPIYAQGRGSSGVEGGSTEIQAFGESGFNNLDAVPNAAPIMLTEPPFEEHLAQNTLWPESHKLYGHGNELFAICSSHSGNLIATVCKAQSETFAQIWLWEVESWRPVCQLKSHVLTVTQLEFSHNDRFLLSVSRDRHLSVFELVKTEPQFGSSVSYALLTRIDAHKRIIWTCSWSYCDRYFATGSRDKMVKIWAVSEKDGRVEVGNILTLPVYRSSVTALAWGPGLLLAVGMEDGSLELWDGRCDTGGVTDFRPSSPVKSAAFLSLGSPKQEKYSKLDMVCLHKFDSFICHVATVHRLAWRTGRIGDDDGAGQLQRDAESGQDEAVPPSKQDLQLASCGADCSVRLFNVRYRKKVPVKV